MISLARAIYEDTADMKTLLTWLEKHDKALASIAAMQTPLIGRASRRPPQGPRGVVLMRAWHPQDHPGALKGAVFVRA